MSDPPRRSQTAPRDTTPGIDWQPWAAAAFARAAAERKPILLAITASWCHGCDVMDRTTYSDAAVVDAVTRGFVPIKVDADRRPDINARYNLDGWPTTAVLTPSGEILTGGTYITPSAMAAMLETARVALRDGYEQLMSRAEQAAMARRAGSPPARYEPDAEAPSWLLARMLAEHDRDHGGFGTGGKFLQPGLLAFGLTMSETAGHSQAGEVVARSLDAIAWGGMFDEVDGGFFRYAAGRDFSRPHTEKLLEDQAALIPVLLDAARALGRDAYRDRALDVIRYVKRTLVDPSRGTFFASQQPDEEYYALSGSIRVSMAPPRVDRTPFADLNAQAIVAWLRAATETGDRALGRFAAGAMERILTNDPTGEGVPHWPSSDAPRDLLTDQVHVGWALVHLACATADRSDYLAIATELMRATVRRFWDERAGGLLDRAPGAPDEIGNLRDPVKPLALNSLAARVLWRLGSMTHDDSLRIRARETLGAITAGYRARGLDAAPYALAVREILS